MKEVSHSLTYLVVVGIRSFAVEQRQQFAEETPGQVQEGSPFLVEGN